MSHLRIDEPPAPGALPTAFGSLEQLLAPIDSKRFLTTIYGQRPSRITGSPSRFADLFSWDEFNRVLTQHRVTRPRLRLVRAGEEIPPEQYMTSFEHIRGSIPHLDWQRLTEHLRGGATLKLGDVEEMHEPITKLCRMFELELRDRVHVNAYAGWFTQQGFDTHWDDHHVFIAQISGRKRWRIFEPTRRHPVTEDSMMELSPPPQPCWEGQLNPGDLLHIPRGWWHDAVPLGEPTLHLTIGTYPETGLDLAKAIVASLVRYESMRADLPKFASADQQAEYMSVFRKTLQEALSLVSLPTYLQEADAKAPARFRASLPWSVMPEQGALPDNLRLHWLPPRDVASHATSEGIAFTAMGTEFRFEGALGAIVSDLAAVRNSSFGELCARHSGTARSEVQKLVLRLVSSHLAAVSAS